MTPNHAFALGLATLSFVELAQGWQAPGGVSTIGDAGVHVVKLDRQDVRQVADCVADAQRGYYVGVVLVGHPFRRLRVSFDTTLGQVMFPSIKCQSAACMERRRYSREASMTARVADYHPEDRDVFTVGLAGEGSAMGDLLHEKVCLHEKACANLGIMAMTEMSEAPFRAMPHDGLIGLGLKSMSVSENFNFLHNLAPHASRPQFGLILGPTGGEIVFGGHNPARLAEGASLAWSQVERPEDGHWQVRLSSVRVGNQSVGMCHAGGCRAIVASSEARIGIPADLFPLFQTHFPADSAEPGASGDFDCQGPTLQFELEGIMLTLRPEDYMTGSSCTPLLSPLQLSREFEGVFVLGEPILKKYYAVFDAEEPPRVGFALAGTGGSAAALSNWPKDGKREDEDEAGGVMWTLYHRLSSWERRLMMACFVVSLTSIVVMAFQCLADLSPVQPRKPEDMPRPGLPPLTPVAPGEAPEMCPICLEQQPEGDIPGRRQSWYGLDCGHQFHYKCIVQWMQRSQRCPLCRRSAYPAPSKPDNGLKIPLFTDNTWRSAIALWRALLLRAGFSQRV